MIYLLKKVQIKRASAPYGKCFTTWAETGMNEEAFELLPETVPGFILPYTQGVI